MTRVEEILAVPGPPDQAKLHQLTMSLKEKLEELKTIDAEILAKVGDTELEEEIAEADLYKEGVFATLIKIERATTTPTAAARVDPVSAPPAHSNKVRLPKLTIKPFNGKLTAWTPFWDSYSSAIHDDPDLTKVDKFNYLRSMVTHEALDAISGLTLTSANYDQAIEVLKKRFGNKQLIINKHMEQLLHVENVTSQHDVRGLRRLYDIVESNVRSLKSLGVESDSYGSLLSAALMNKLPSEMRLTASKKFATKDTWSLNELLPLIEEEVQARERTSTRRDDNRRPKDLPSGHSLFVDTTPRRCCFCQQEHPPQECKLVTGDARREALRSTGRCYVCLGKGHVSRNCRSRVKCLNCRGRHNVAICSKGSGSKPEVPDDKKPLNPQATPYQPEGTGNLWIYSSGSVLLQTAQTIAFNPDCLSKTQRVRIVLDTGSQRSYITESARKSLALATVGEQSMLVTTFGSSQRKERTCEYVKVGLKMKIGQNQILTLFSVPTICEPLSPHPIRKCQQTYDHLAGLELADKSNDAQLLRVDILIGSDHYWDLITGGLRRGTEGPTAVQTTLGWILSGPVSSTDHTDVSHQLLTGSLLNDSKELESRALEETMRSFWELESFGIPATDQSLYDEFCNSVKFQDGRYEVRLPWKTPRHDPPDNFNLSLQRLNSLLRRLRHDPDLLAEYDLVIETQLKQGIVERVDSPADNQAVHYLPHHPVIRKDKSTTKLRVVYDASAKTSGRSLNDCLNPGPKFDQKIFDILVRFRVHNIAVTADIEKAFLMISVAEPDREFLRFLWVDDPLKENPQLAVYRFARVIFGVTASPFLLNATIRYHLESNADSHGELISKMQRSIYVDDLVTGACSEDDAYQLYSSAKEVLKTGAFNLRKFSSNSSGLQEKITDSQTSEKYERKVLGVSWNTSSDQIQFSLAELAEDAQQLAPTKRNLIRLIGKFYDPLGFLAPIVVSYKIFMQSLFATKIEWDENIPKSVHVGKMAQPDCFAQRITTSNTSKVLP